MTPTDADPPTEEDVLDRATILKIAHGIRGHPGPGAVELQDATGCDCGKKVEDWLAHDAALRQLLADEKQDRRDYEDLAELNGEVADTLSAEVTRLRSRIEALEAEREQDAESGYQLAYDRLVRIRKLERMVERYREALLKVAHNEKANPANEANRKSEIARRALEGSR